MSVTRTLYAALFASTALVALPGQASAACMPTNNPTGGETITCSGGLDTTGVNGPTATGVTVNTEAPSGGISTTGQPGVLLGDGATVNVGAAMGSAFPINTSGDLAAGIDVQNGATITVDGQVATSGGTSPAITTGDGAQVTVNGAAVGRVQTGGGMSPAISVGANSTVETTGSAVVTTGNSNSAAIRLRGDASTATIGTDGRITTSSGMSNPILVEGNMGTVNVSGDVQSSAGDATAILATGDMTTVNVRDGGAVSASSSNSNGIESQGTGATITVENGGEVAISSGNSSAIVAGENAMVMIDGTVSASSSQSQGVVLGNGSTLTVQSRGIIETSSSESQAVLVEEGAMTATVNVDRGGNIDGVGAQAIVDRGMTNTTVTVDGRVFGGSSEPVLDMGAGDDEVIVNGTVTGTSAMPVVQLGAGDDRLENNSSQTISGPGTLADGGSGNDTLVVANGTTNNSSDYQGFETTMAQRNANPNDPNNGMETTLNVNDTQTGRQNTMAGEGGTVNVQSGGDAGNVSAMMGGSVNVQSGGSAQVTQDGQAGANQGGSVNFEQGSTARVNAGGTGAAPESQTFTGTNFDPGTGVEVANRDFSRGAISATPGQIDLTTDFSGSAVGSADGNSASFTTALDAAIAAGGLTAEQQAAIDTLATSGAGEGSAALFALGGVAPAQTAAAGFDAALSFNSVLRPVTGLGGTRAFAAAQPATGVGALAVPGALGEPMTSNADLAVDTPAPVPVLATAERGLWIAGLGRHLDVDTTALGVGFDADSYGVAVGYETGLAELGLGDGTFGVALGYTTTDVDTFGASGDVDTYSIGVYAGGTAGAFTGRVSLAYSFQDLDAGAVSLDGDVFSAVGEGVYDFIEGPVTFGVLGRLEANFADYDGFATGALATLGGADVEQYVAGIGVRLGGDVEVGATTVSLELDALYEGLAGDETASFAGNVAGNAFVTGARITDDSRIRLGVGAGFALSDTASLDLRYDATLADDADAHSGSVKLTFKF